MPISYHLNPSSNLITRDLDHIGKHFCSHQNKNAFLFLFLSLLIPISLHLSPCRIFMDLYCGKQRKRSKPENQDEEKSKMESLPQELMLDILSRLSIPDLIPLKFVRKEWSSLFKDPQLYRMHLSTISEANPCLILHADYPIKNWLYFTDFPVTEDIRPKTKKFTIPFSVPMPEFDVVGSCNGLLCLTDTLYKDAVYIYNPFTRDSKELPKSVQFPNQELVFGFGCHPETKEYKVVKIVYYTLPTRGVPRPGFKYPKSDVQVLTLGDPRWRNLGKMTHLLEEWPSEALISGRLHWATRVRRRHPARSIISFDLADENFREVPTPDSGDFKWRIFHLMVLDGCLAVVHGCYYGQLDIWVMKNYDMKESWIKEFNIGNYLPRGLRHNPHPMFKIGKRNKSKAVYIRILCMMKNGEILIEYNSNALVAYDPKHGIFRDLFFQGMPTWFHTIVHQGSLNWIEV